MKNIKVALVTEAGNGLGIKFASILGDAGYKTIIAAESQSLEVMNKEDIGDIEIVEVDLTKKESVVKIYAYIKTYFGQLDVLVNNAEIGTGFGQKIEALNIREMKQLYDENFFSVISLVQTLLPLLKKSENSNIINITSPMGDIDNMEDDNFVYANYQMTAYATAKAALNMYTVLQAREFQSTNIGISGFDPIRMKNCTHNDVQLCTAVKKEFLELLEQKKVPIS
ncbi:MAG: SDR family NAD(P)-dependent oxidoreductase [Maribacter sp.]